MDYSFRFEIGDIVESKFFGLDQKIGKRDYNVIIEKNTNRYQTNYGPYYKVFSLVTKRFQDVDINSRVEKSFIKLA